jgi:hypothetical protein
VRARLIGARLLVVLFTLLAIVGMLAGYVRYQALDNDTVRRTASELIADDAVRDQIAASLVDGLYANVDVAAALEEQLPPDQQRLAPIAAAGLRELSDRAAQRLLERPRTQALWVESVSRSHRQLLRLLDDDLTVVRTEGGVVALDLAPLVEALGDRVAVVENLASRLPPDAGRIEIVESDELETAQTVTELLRILGPIVWILALLVGALAVWLAAGRRRVILRALALGLVVAGLVVLVLRGVAGSYVVDSLVATESVRPAAANAWEILTALLGDGAWTAVGLGVVALVGLWLAGPSRSAVGSRSALAPYLARPELAYGAAAVLALLVVWWGPTAQTRRWDFVLVAAVLLGAGLEVLRRQTAREHPDAGAQPLELRPRLPSLRREVAADRLGELEQLGRLRDAGVLSADEFTAEKTRILGSAA